MRWQGVARAVVALIGIGCAVTVYVMLRPMPEAAPPQQPIVLKESETTATKGTKVKIVDATGRETFSMEAESTRALADGRKFLLGVRLTFARGGVNYVVTSDEAETAGKANTDTEEPSKVVFRKRVKMVGDDGFSVEASEATYLGDEQRVTFPGPVVFNRNRLAGTGIGGDLFMERSVFWTYDQSRMTIKPDAGGASVAVTAKQIGLAQNEGYLRAVEGAQMTRGDQQLSADTIATYFTEGTQNVRRIELVGRSGVRETGTGQRPDMRGDNIDLDFTTDTSLLTHARMDRGAVLTLPSDAGPSRVTGTTIDLYVGKDGETLTKLDATGPTEVTLPRDGETPARTIQSAGLVADGVDPKGLERAAFRGGVQYRETLAAGRGQAATVRLASSVTLLLTLGGKLNQVNRAEFHQKFCFAGPLAAGASLDPQCALARMVAARGSSEDTVAAAADEGHYDAKAETLQLRPTGASRSRANVVNQEIDVTAREIDLDLKQDGIDARGEINSVRKPTAAQAKTQTATGLFENGKPISGGANKRLTYSRTTGIATYLGEVLLFQKGADGQEGSTLKADEVSIDDRKQDIKATGHVKSIFFIEGAPDEAGKKGPTRTLLNSDRMEYTEALRTAVYQGAALMESGEGVNRQSLEAEKITLEMHPQQRALKRLTATASGTGLVLARLPDGRQATGLEVTYDADTDMYEVKGTLAQFVSHSTTKGPDTCEVVRGGILTFSRTAGVANARNEVGQGIAREAKCVDVLKK